MVVVLSRDTLFLQDVLEVFKSPKVESNFTSLVVLSIYLKKEIKLRQSEGRPPCGRTT